MQVTGIPTQVQSVLEEIGRLADQQRVTAYAIGGCVRDWLLGRSSTADLDMTVVGDGIDFANAIANSLGVQATPHEQFGTATLAFCLDRPGSARRQKDHASRTLRIDIATCRAEHYPEPAAYPRVRAGTIEEDLFRRDFTVNAMGMLVNHNRFGELVDLFGGLRDLRAGRLRVLHPKSFLDDPSRILRAARFLPRFGFRLETKTSGYLKQAIRRRVLARLNRGRFRKELDRMAEEPDPLRCLTQLAQWLSLPQAK